MQLWLSCYSYVQILYQTLLKLKAVSDGAALQPLQKADLQRTWLRRSSGTIRLMNNSEIQVWMFLGDNWYPVLSKSIVFKWTTVQMQVFRSGFFQWTWAMLTSISEINYCICSVGHANRVSCYGTVPPAVHLVFEKNVVEYCYKNWFLTFLNLLVVTQSYFLSIR